MPESGTASPAAGAVPPAETPAQPAEIGNLAALVAGIPSPNEQGSDTPKKKRRDRERRRHPKLTRAAWFIGLAAVAVLAVGGAVWFGGPRTQRTTIHYGTTTKHVGIRGSESVRKMLRKTGIHIRRGRELTAVTHSVLDPTGGKPATATVDGAPVSLSDKVKGGSTVTVLDGTDVVEPVVNREGPIPAPAPPAVLVHLWNLGTPGEGRLLVGERSGEVVQSTPRIAPIPASRVTAKVVALTFDDGPGPFTLQILAILQAKGVKATFCMIGQQVPTRADIVRQVAAAGMAVCNHTRNHDERLNKESHDAVETQISGGAQPLIDLGLPTPQFYRPPGGALSPDIVATARKHGETVLYWKVDPADWKRPPVAAIVANVVGHVDPGAIVLLHDGGGDRANTVAALPIIIDQLHAAGYQFVLPTPTPPNSGTPLPPEGNFPAGGG